MHMISEITQLPKYVYLRSTSSEREGKHSGAHSQATIDTVFAIRIGDVAIVTWIFSQS